MSIQFSDFKHKDEVLIVTGYSRVFILKCSVVGECPVTEGDRTDGEDVSAVGERARVGTF